ncbi:hypothetical protein Tco_0382932 [Tanacetum coccineum]
MIPGTRQLWVQDAKGVLEASERGMLILLEKALQKKDVTILSRATEEIVGIHPSSAEEFVTMRSVTRRIAAAGKPKTNL